MTTKLKDIIDEAKANNHIYMIDWDSYPLPVLNKERLQSTLNLNPANLDNYSNMINPSVKKKKQKL